MIVERGKKILIVCIIVVLIIILIDFFLLPKLSPLVGRSLLFGLFFFLAYRGYNWSRICLFVLLLFIGLYGSYYGAKVLVLYKYPHPVGIVTVIMGILNLSVGLILFLNKSVKAFVNRDRS